MKTSIRLFVAVIFSLPLILQPAAANAATITIRPVILNGNLRLDGTVTIVAAVDGNDQPIDVPANAVQPRRATGEIDIRIDDPTNVRAITIRVGAEGSPLTSNLERLFLRTQEVTTAIPDVEPPCCIICQPSLPRRCQIFHRKR